MRRLISLLVVLVVGVLIYNSMFGTPEEKAQAKEVTQEAKEVFNSVKNLLKSEKEKFQAGKYDGILDKLKSLKGKGEQFGDEYSDKLEDIERQIAELEQLESKKKKRSSAVEEYSTEEEEINKKLQNLLNSIEKE